jgi:DNA-binding response OmpR family regulator
VAKLLLVEDNEDLADTIEAELLLERHTVDKFHNGLDGLEALRSTVYDVVILDWDLPGMPGIKILSTFRTEGGVTPVIMLTGKSDIVDKETGLDTGADDYLTKPFSSRELAARIRSLLRRPPQVRSNVVEHNGIVLDPAAFSAIRDGVTIRLQPRDFALLEFFMRHPGEVFDVDALMDRVWKLDAECSPPAVRMAITRIRKAIDKEGEESVIENLPRVGYRLRK